MEKRTDEDVSNPLLSDIQRKNPKAYAELLTEQASMVRKDLIYIPDVHVSSN